ncbi:hypothetical protein HNP38_000089 [Chryseobacterium defluvii]|uniref:Uncharacterized protein n=1 Tax=Chryseobacterium defluvii TaxID=160396 RepID=A0A840K9Y0_9FLAO|nr:hypothetical protein [Chryseobacterium defluvii]MBB4804817.1 hypothetical protein [Chryseobacterium defluvii]
MKAYTPSKYPVFEADQVLSQKHLNRAISYLEEQDRLTRVGGIGIGILCGLEISHPKANQITISCGTAITSLGYQIQWEEQTFSYYHPVELSPDFLAPVYIDGEYLDKVLPHTKIYEPLKNSIELLPTNTLEGDRIAIPDQFFENKIVVLLLETSLIDEKNCVTTNCDDKGKRLEFKIRPLLVSVDKSNAFLFPEYPEVVSLEKICLPRYNVPNTQLVTGSQVLNEFKKIIANPIIEDLSNKIGSAYNNYKPIINNNAGLNVLSSVKTSLEAVINANKNSINVQYLWDWIFDISFAYNEIVEFSAQNPSLCCVDESLFPFHVVLGEADDSGTEYRTPFFSTQNSSGKNNKKKQELTLLFERLVHIIKSWKIQNNGIKVTPSLYGNIPLSGKSIPFYYDHILELNKKWSPKKTIRNRNNEILSYHSEVANYTSLDCVKKPLLYDIEPYNFFRIEGHLGKKYADVVEELTIIKNSYNLPFKITALNAVDYIGKELDISKFQGRWDDLETDYDLARKRLYNITEFVINWINQRRTTLVQQNLLTNSSIDSFKNILQQIKNLLTNDLKDFLPNFISFNEVFKELNQIFLMHRFCIQFLNNDKLSMIAEDLIDRFDDINELFLEDPFAVIFEESQIRWKTIFKDLFLSTFIQKHPGMEHKAGVTKGGTFILVYVDSSVFKPKAPVKYFQLLESIKIYKQGFNLEESVMQDITSSIKFKDYTSQIVNPPIEELDKCKQETENIKANILKLADYNMSPAYTKEMKTYLLGNLSYAMQYYNPNQQPQEIPNQQLVIADFFLPYLCCGDGNTVEIKIEKKEPLAISLNTLKYCNTDDKEYEVVIKGKSGGTFLGTAKDAVIKRSDKFFLQPGHASIATPAKYTLQYESEGELSNTLEIEISKPQQISNWSGARTLQDIRSFDFTNAAQEDTHQYEIDFGDKSEKITTDKKVISHTFPFNERVKAFTVIIKQLGEICENSQKITVNAVGDFNNPDFDEKDFYTQK